jgi:hypothetical protein
VTNRSTTSTSFFQRICVNLRNLRTGALPQIAQISQRTNLVTVSTLSGPHEASNKTHPKAAVFEPELSLNLANESKKHNKTLLPKKNLR